MTADSFAIVATEKTGIPSAACRSFRARVTAKTAVDISARAGVVKDYETFGRMVYNAMIGKTPCVTFYIETCDEMKTRIRAEQSRLTDSEIGRHDSSEDEPASLHSGASQELQQRFFTLDYDVDFTRAMFPIPLVEGPATLDEPIVQPAPSSGIGPTSHKNSPQATRPDASTVHHHHTGATTASFEAVVEENRRLKKQVDALTILSKEKMVEMQRECDGLQRRIAIEGRLRQELAAAKASARLLQEEKQALQRQLAAAESRGRKGRDPSREGLTPRSGSRASSVDSRSSSRRIPGASPAPDGRTGGRRGASPVVAGAHRPNRFDTPPKRRLPGDSPSASANRSGSSKGRQLYEDVSVTTASSSGSKPSRFTSPPSLISSTHERLFSMNTAAQRQKSTSPDGLYGNNHRRADAHQVQAVFR